ncbi:anaphase-promoting complex subunit, putative [Plasmodium ovale wallikeri]|uniref:Anaphase-promoting complex subunit, putative n=2 Tax=Plasmodium ovale TaxID=36330 RepID=A0A1A8YYM6_PLAOA|nr:anaphase-promoting complex subunit, putative [Plasmodium ovale wallikeri]SBT57256.1 anaphase-promoting complex subunit, putative [Plasmodium ovale wallikeri]SBT74424.1 anaphase promoting complex subunit, putative [Plasmodium ovale]
MKEEDCGLSCYLNFLTCGLHFSKKYNLKFQRRLYQDLLDTYYYRNSACVKRAMYPDESYLEYSDLCGLYKYTKRKCREDNCENVMKYGYIYCCYKLKKEDRKTMVLMLLDEDFIKYNCHYGSYENYKKKDVQVYAQNFHNVKYLPGYSVGYYLMGKIYEKEAKREWMDNTKKKKLIDIAFYCYYLGYKSCPFFICSLKKLLKLHGNFYSNATYWEEVNKISKIYNFGTDIYKIWKRPSASSGGEEAEEKDEEKEKATVEKNRNAEFDNKIIDLIDFSGDSNNIDIKNVNFILSLVEEDAINNSFLEWITNFKDSDNISTDTKSNCISKEGIYDLETVGKFYFCFYVNDFKECLLLIEEWENEPIFSICILYIKGLCYFLLRNYEKSSSFFEKIDYIDCYYTKHLPFLSTCYWHEKNIDKIEYILTAYPKIEVDEYFLCLIGNYFSLKSNKKLAAEFFRKAIMLNTFYEYSYILYSCEMKFLGETRKAALALSKCLQINPCNLKAHLLLSAILFQERKIELSNIHLSLCLKLNSMDALVCLYCASLYNNSEKYETALLCLEHAQKNDYKGIDLFIMQGIIFLKIKRHSDALNSFLKAQKMNPTCSFISALVAFTLVLEKKFDKSKNVIKELVLNNSNNINKNLLKDIYKCCNLKIVPNKYVQNKIEFFFKEGSFLDSMAAFENAQSP